ncbi:MAG: hypothetical protein R3B69_01755 [Candidatus Paceibacterota bacterium]
MKYLLVFNALYLILGGVYFLRDLNHEFVIYVAVIVAILGGVLLLVPIHVSRFGCFGYFHSGGYFMSLVVR